MTVMLLTVLDNHAMTALAHRALTAVLPAVLLTVQTPAVPRCSDERYHGAITDNLQRSSLIPSSPHKRLPPASIL